MREYDLHEVHTFLIYYEKYYVGKDLKDGVYALAPVNCFFRFQQFIPLTSNTCELFHHGLKSSFNAAHPDVNTLLFELKTRDSIMSREKTMAMLGDFLAPNYDRTEKYKEIRELYKNYERHYDLTFIIAISSIYSWNFD